LQGGILKAIRLTRVLDYFDCTLVVEAKDERGLLYVGVRVPDGFPGEYVVVRVGIRHLESFLRGSMDLLTLMNSRRAWTFGSTSETSHHEILVGRMQDGAIPDACLPEPGYVLDPGAIENNLRKMERSKAAS
jgi:hypothetical protein